MFGISFRSTNVVWRITLIAVIPISVSLLGVIASAVIPRTAEVPLTQTVDQALAEQSGMIGEYSEFTPAVTTLADGSFRHPDLDEFFPDRELPSGSVLPAGGQISTEAEPPVQLVSHAVSVDPKPDALPPVPISLARVDTLILAGNYPFAAQLLEEFEGLSSGLVTTQIRFRRGLCAELLGDPQRALIHYRSLAETHHSTVISDAATLASARTLIERGHRDVGNAMLLRLLLNRERSMRRDLRGDVVHTLAAGLLPVAERDSLLQESQWLTVVRNPTPEELLGSWSKLGPDGSPPKKRDTLNVRRLTSSPPGILVTMQFSALDITQILSKLASELNWSFTADGVASRMVHNRTLAVDFEELPLDVVLDALLIPHGVRWKYDRQQLSIDAAPIRNPDVIATGEGQSVSEVQPNRASEQDRFRVADRFLQLAVNVAPEHPSAPLSYVLLGTTAAKMGDVETAITFFNMSIDLFPRSPSVGVATFNLGKACLNQGQRREALKHFFRTIDNVAGLETDAVAYLYIGRILLENDTPRDAISPLMHGLSVVEGTEYEAPAALLLSAAYLLNGNAIAANSVLLEHRPAFEARAKHSRTAEVRVRQMAQQAAFLSSLARFWGTQGTQRIREGRALLAALTHVKVDTMFGRHSAFLVGVAFAAVGLSSEQDAIFRQSLAEPHGFPLQQRMRSLLTGQIAVEDSLQPEISTERVASEAAAPGETAPARAQPTPTERTALSRAEAAYRDGKYDEVLQSCHKLLRISQATDTATTNDPMPEQTRQFRKTTLRLMGLVYQTKGQHEQAVRCFAGIPPMLPNDHEKENQL